MSRPLALLALIAVCMLGLVYGPSALVEARLGGGLPFGTLLVIVALVAGASLPLAVRQPGALSRWIAGVAIITALTWFPVGVVLSGDAGLNFVNDAADSARFASITRRVVAVVLAAMAWAGVSAAWRWWRPRTEGEA